MTLNSTVFHSSSYKLTAGFLIIIFLGYSVNYAHSESLNKTERLNSELLFAIIDNDINAITRLINDGANVNFRDNFGNTLLHYAIQEETIKVLIKAGTDVNARNIFGNTPLHYDSRRSMHYEKVLSLVKAKADVNIRNNIGKTSLDYVHHVAAHNALIKAGALTSNELLQKEGQVESNFELSFAVIGMDIETVVKLLATEPNVNIRDIFGKTLLHYAVKPAHQFNSNSMKRHKKFVEILIAAGVDINARDNTTGKTSMDIDTEYGYSSDVLRGAGALTSDELLQQELNSELLFAVINNDIEVVKRLINDEANVNIRDNFGNTLLHYAKNTTVIRTLKEAGVDVNTKNKFGNTPLHSNSQGHIYSIENEKIKKVLALIEAGAEVNVKNDDGKTPLDYGHSIRAHNALIKAGAIVSSICAYVLL